MAIGAVDNSGRFTPEYAAYTKLTLNDREVKVSHTYLLAKY